MVQNKHRRTLVYKRTHSGDPDPKNGVFGEHDCMGTVRAWEFDAVIGVGGIGPQPVRCQIARKLTWVGIGPEKWGDPRRPLVRFKHFQYFGENGPLLEMVAPTLARRIYERNIRTRLNSASEAEQREVEKILKRAETAKPSRTVAQHISQRTCSKRNRC